MVEKPKKICWDRLSPDKQDLYLTLLWRDGYTEQAISVFLNTTKGRIVRRRHTLKLKNKGRKTIKSKVESIDRLCDLLDLQKMKKVEERGVLAFDPVVETKIPETELEEDPPVEEPPSVEEAPPPAVTEVRVKEMPSEQPRESYVRQRTASREKPKYQLTTDWRLQCIHSEGGFQCSYVKEPDSDYCKLHGR